MENKLKIIAEKANNYDLTQLISLICDYSRPSEIRKELMQCYYLAAKEAIKSDLDCQTIIYSLDMLQLLIEALDNTTTTDKPPIIACVNNNQ